MVQVYFTDVDVLGFRAKKHKDWFGDNKTSCQLMTTMKKIALSKHTTKEALTPTFYREGMYIFQTYVSIWTEEDEKWVVIKGFS